MIFRWRYYHRAAYRAGVPIDDIPDAVQDIAIACWLAGSDDTGIVYRKAIDAARRYGPRTRRGYRRPLLLPLDAAEGEPAFMAEPPIVTRSALLTAFRAMTERQRTALCRRLRGDAMSSLDSQHASAARRHVRRALAA